MPQKDPQLQKLIDDLKTKKFRDGEAKGLVQTIGDEIKTQLAPLFSALSKEITTTVKDSLANVKINVPKSEAPNVQIPDFPQIPPFPEMKAPIVNIPAPIVNIPAPQVTVSPSEVNFPSEMSLKAGNKPFPVIMHDAAGKPINFSGMSGGSIGGRGDFFAIRDIQTSSGASIIDQVDGALKVVGSFSVSASNNSTQSIDSSGTPYSQANPLPVIFSSSASTASALVDSTGVQYSGSNPLPTTATITLPSGPGDGATASRFIQAGDTVSSINILQINGNTPATGLNETNAGVLRMVQMTDSVSSVVINSGTLTTLTTLTGVTNSIAVVSLDRDGNPLTTGPIAQGDSATALRVIQAGDSVSSVVVNSGTITTVTTLTGVTNSIATVLTDSSGVQYSGSNPVPTTATITLPSGPGDGATATRFIQAGDTVSSTNILQINGNTPATGLNETTSGVLRTVLMTDSVTSVVVNSGTITTVTGITNTVNVRLDTPDGIVTSANPFPIALASGGLDSTFVLMARTTNATAVADGADVRPKADKLGRALVRPLQVRDLIKTAYVSLTTGTEATLLAGVAGAFLDLIMLTATNNSTAATQLDIRNVTAGNIIHTMYLPASTGPVGFAPTVPWPQDATGNNWTIDMPDQTGTTVYVSALFSQEI